MEETTEKIIFNKSLELLFMTPLLKNMRLKNANKLNRKWNAFARSLLIEAISFYLLLLSQVKRKFRENITNVQREDRTFALTIGKLLTKRERERERKRVQIWIKTL